jgi:UDP-glucuronate 4-epimerase
VVRSWLWLQQGNTHPGICEIFNLGGSHPIPLLQLVRLLETALDCKAAIDWQPDQPGDVPVTFADLRKSQSLLGYQPQVDIATGIQHFAAWFQQQSSQHP